MIKSKKTILITGAHVTPAVALIQAWKRKFPNSRVAYVGRKHTGVTVSVEQEEVERAGSEFFPLEFGKFHRYLTIRQLKEFLKMPIGMVRGVRILAKVRPEVVISFGGYLSVPLVLGAKLLRIPILIHEQTVIWGKANNFLRKFADVSAVSWQNLLEAGMVLTGNPIREEVIAIKRVSTKVPVLYITGGNQGSRVIDKVVEPALSQLVKKYEIFHQTRHPGKFRHERYHVADWFPTPEHADILSKTVLSISRAGANTVTELMFLGIPSLLIPLPHAGNNEQLKNAEMMAKTGLGQILAQNVLSTKTLLAAVLKMGNWSNEELIRAGNEAGKLIKPRAAEEIMEKLLTLI